MGNFSVYFLVVVFFVSLIAAYIEWTRYTQKIHESKIVVKDELKKVAIKICLFSIVTGLSFGLAVGIMEMSPTGETSQNAFSLAPALFCSIGWGLVMPLGLLLKVMALMELYKK